MKKLMPFVGATLAASIAALWLLLTPGVAAQQAPAPVATTTPAKPELSHRQDVWLYALEWCESRGNPAAVNPNDRDNTPSYYSFQFKPDTFAYYGVMYGVIPAGLGSTTLAKDLKSYELQRAIVKAMVLDSTHIDWSQQFPDCVRKLGPPPQK